MNTQLRADMPVEYWKNNSLATEPFLRSSLVEQFNSGVRLIDDSSYTALGLLRNLGRSYEKFSNSFSPRSQNPLREIGGSLSAIQKSFNVVAEQRPEAGLSRSASAALGAMNFLAKGADAIVGVGDALVSFANDYDRGDRRYSEFMRVVPKVVGQSLVLGGAGVVAGTAVGIASTPAVATIGLGVLGAWGFGKLYDSIFG